MQGFGVYLASRTEEENQLLKRKLEPLKDEFRNMRFVGLHPQGLALSAHEKMAAVVINVPEWNRTETAALLSLRGQGFHGPVLVTAKVTASQALRNLRALDAVVFLEKPFETKDLLGILRKMLHARVVAQRVHRRFNTDEMAEVTLFGKNDAYASKVINISKGGACLEFDNVFPIRIGDMVRMKVELKAVNRTYTVPARVVWAERGSEARPSARGAQIRSGVGIQFVGAPDVRKSTLTTF